MGNGGFKRGGGDSEKDPSSEQQLCLSLKLQQTTQSLPSGYAPYVTGSLDCLGAWNPSKSVALDIESSTSWELSFVFANDAAVEFKYLLKPKQGTESYIMESGPNRVLKGEQMEKDAMPIASFHLPGELEPLEFVVSVTVDAVSPISLGASWRLHKENLGTQSSMVRGVMDPPLPAPERRVSRELELDLDHYEVPTPVSATDPEGGGGGGGVQYVANAAEDPRKLLRRSASVPVPFSNSQSRARKLDRTQSKDRSVSVKDLVLGSAESPLISMDFHSTYEDFGSKGKYTTEPGVIEETDSDAGANAPSGEVKTVGTDPISPSITEDQQRKYIDKGVGGLPRLVKRQSDVNLNMLDGEGNLVPDEDEDMPAASGAVAAGAVADRLLGPKERRQLAIVLVGLPARGKTFTAAKLTRYLRWLGHDTKHFNVGKYRRLKFGCSQSADFFRADNQEGVDARNEVAILAMEDMLSWMSEGGQVGVFDATNSTNERRKLLLKVAEGKCKVIFLETICNDKSVIDQNIRLKIQQSPDYADKADEETALVDFRTRLENYERVYETVTEGSYIKMIDTASPSGSTGQMHVSNISGYLPGRIVFFLVNTHITPRPILLTRHGESVDNVRGRIGGDSTLSPAGEKYASKLSDFLNKRLKNERTASIWTSTLQRTVVTARNIAGFPRVQWRALDEINVGVCDGMTYEEVQENMPEEFLARKQDKLRYRYPRGESYLDVIQRLEPVIIELERQRSPVVVIAHQAVLRALYAYFRDKPLKEVPDIEMPLHTIIEIQMGVTGVQEKRYKLM